MKPEYTGYLEEALARYHLSGAGTELIRHNENMAFRVEGKYLLRIHKPAQGISTHLLYEGLGLTDIRRAELQFLIHLGRRGMYVQTPVANQKGELVTVLGDGTPATLLTWLPGRTPAQSGINAGLCRQLGAMLAKLHRASKDFIPSHALRYDASLCGRMREKIRLLQTDGTLEPRSVQVLAEVCDIISAHLRGAEDDFFPVHADLSLSNLLMTRSGPAPIDFSLFGIGHPMLDVSALYCCLNDAGNRSALAAGYLAAGGAISFPLLDCCFALNILLGILFCCGRPGQKEWIAQRQERWLQETFLPFAAGKALFSRDFCKIKYGD